MDVNEVVGDFRIPNRVWIEIHADSNDARDVIVEMEDGMVYTALFVTFPYLRRQMELSVQMSEQVPDTTPVPFAMLDTPHIVTENLDRETIEDTIDNLLAMDTFNSIFTQVTEDNPSDSTPTTNGNGRRATQEVAAVVLSDVLMVEAED
jgi:hypothetical protein